MYFLRFLHGNETMASGQLATNPDLEEFFQETKVFVLPENQTEDPKVFRIGSVSSTQRRLNPFGNTYTWLDATAQELGMDLEATRNWLYRSAATMSVEPSSAAKGHRQILSLLEGNTELVWDALEITKE